MSPHDLLPESWWIWLRDHLWWDLLMDVPAGASWVAARFRGLPASRQWAAFSVTEVLLGITGIAAVSRYGGLVALPILALMLIAALYQLEILGKSRTHRIGQALPGLVATGAPRQQHQSGPHLPPGFSIRAQELRSGSNPLAPHVLRLELQISASIRGYLVRFFCNGPIYRKACHFQQDGTDVGVAEAGPGTDSITLRVGPRAFAEPGILTAGLASIGPLKLLRIESEPYFDFSLPHTRGESVLLRFA